MHCARTPELDLPQYLQDRIKDSISSGNLVETSMGKDKPILEDVLSKIDNHDRREYFKSIYGYNAAGFILDEFLEKQILEHYSSFLNTIDEKPKLTIKLFTSDTGLPLHSDKKQSCSLTTLIFGVGPKTEWHEIKDKYKKYYYQDDDLKGGSLPMPHETQLIEEHLLEEWKTCIFDHRAIHKVNTNGTASKRMMMSVGWLNTPYYIVEQKYEEWKKLC